MIKQMAKDDFIVSKTDLKGRITYANRIFIDMAEYTEEELLGQPHSIIRHDAMPKAVFQLLWDTVTAGEEIFAFVINRTKNGNDYWIYANVSPSFDENGTIVGYYSVRRMPNQSAIAIVKPLYKAMLQAEKTGGIAAGVKVLTDLLGEKGVGYNELIIAIQG
ncbi:PAS domain-containing protein [Sulfurimonas sp. SAG-AH-194-I05]|nr:PAS domain-containing protein [Sulfurimonas sp. SAG-AH-194-I05]MDF1875260.1 PAS domain-containing protein [Sulfurimonas sp. SAG-AH-194-I05]